MRLLRQFAEQLQALDGGASSTAVERVSPVTIGPAPRVIVGPADDRSFGDRSALGRIIVTPRVPIAVEPPARPVWDELGWTETIEGGHRVYDGMFVVRRRSGETRSFRGRIVLNATEATPYIADPPPEIKRHRKGPCFALHSAPWFRVHWQRPATDVDGAILYVQRILHEVLK